MQPLNTTTITLFPSRVECLNQTNTCYGHGLCIPTGSLWSCKCNLFYLPNDNCLSFFSVFFGKFIFIWCISISVYCILFTLVSTEILLNLKIGKWKNAMMVLKGVLLLYLSFRIVECSLWFFNAYRTYPCDPCVNALYVILLFPFVLGVLVLSICVIVWYSLIMTFKMRQDLYKLGRNIYIGFGIIYGIGSCVLLPLITVSVDVYLQFLTFWVIIPLFLIVVHCLVEVFNLRRELKHREMDKSLKKAQKKNTILGILSIIYLFFIAVTILQVFYGNKAYLNYPLWLILHSSIRLLEMIILLMFYKFSEKYSSQFFLDKTDSSLSTSTTKKSTTGKTKSHNNDQNDQNDQNEI
eukprot:TRINITY_DN16093_c0_g1_i1.p1 TRINITY_DN16093_c0_g1~~TRINITY_DN16093_c0_g1_i1.p1  ORF type:complete len:352 (-),score=56.01 TRINITY_DN16093_c0_g1_i1:48-1103(-)